MDLQKAEINIPPIKKEYFNNDIVDNVEQQEQEFSNQKQFNFEECGEKGDVDNKEEIISNNTNDEENNNLFDNIEKNKLNEQQVVLFSSFYCHDIITECNSFFRCVSLALTGTQKHYGTFRQSISEFAQ